MKKLKVLLLTGVLVLSLLGCGEKANEIKSDTTDKVSETHPTNESDKDTTDSDLDILGDVEVDEGLLNVEITMPAEYAEGVTQEDLDASITETGYKSAKLNDDGSVTYVMSKSVHNEMLKDMAADMKGSLSEMVGSEDTPNITKIDVNDNFTDFTVTTKSSEISMTESFAVMSFYMFGGMYGIFTGETPDNVKVTYINADSGEIIETANSKDLE